MLTLIQAVRDAQRSYVQGMQPYVASTIRPLSVIHLEQAYTMIARVAERVAYHNRVVVKHFKRFSL